MIPILMDRTYNRDSKPRASGDDPPDPVVGDSRIL